MNILFLSRWYPQPPDNGSKLRIANLLRVLSGRHDVTVVSFCEASACCRPEPLPFAGRVRVCPVREFDPGSLRSRLGFLSPTPRHLVGTHSGEMEQLIRSEAQRSSFDLVIASQLSMAAYHGAFRGIPAILEEAELAMYLPEQNSQGGAPGSMRRRLTWLKHRRYMARLLDSFGACTVASEAERRLVALVAPGYSPVHVIPNFVDLDQYPARVGARQADSLIFTGSLLYGPNLDAVLWFAKDVWPLIKAEAPNARLTVTGEPGSSPAPKIAGVEFTGRVTDVRPLVAGSAVSVVPIRQGGGTRLKILEAMALRTPVVTTSKGVEGLEAEDGVHLSIADTPQDFARAVVNLLRREQYARELAENAFRLLRSKYESGAVGPRFLEVVELAAAGGAGAAREAALSPA